MADLQFSYMKDSLNLYSSVIPEITILSPIANLVCFSGPVSINGIVSGIIQYTNTAVEENQNDLIYTSSTITVTFNDEYNSTLSWIMSWTSPNFYLPPNSKYILNLTSGSGKYLNKTGVIVIDVSETRRDFYVKFN
jgi:hypothetical protein